MSGKKVSDMKMIYILNQYSQDSAQHFYHIIHLLEVMANKGVKIILLIEKADGQLELNNPNIKIVVQKEKKRVKRVMELYRICAHYIDKGFKKVFIRISMNAALVVIRCARKHGGETYFWQSGDNLLYDRQRRGLDKIKWLLTNQSELVYIKNHIDHFVTGPETMVEYYIKELGVKREKMMLLYNDIDINRFRPGTETDRTELRNTLRISEDAKIVLFVHRLTPVKRFSNAIPFLTEAEDFRKLNAYFVVIGGGPEEELIKKNVESSPFSDRIILLGKQPNSIIDKYYKGSDVFINPSYSEGFPRVAIEAMAAGLPIVVTDVGGTKDILPDEEKKYMVDKDSLIVMREQIIDLLNDSEKRKSLSSINRKFVERYSTENVADMYIDSMFKKDK